MSDPVVFEFEEVDGDLSRPPIAAQRAFLSTGVMVTSRGWRALSPADRKALAAAGSRGVVDPATVQSLVKLVPIAEVKLCAKTSDPDRSQVPPRLNAAIGTVRPITTDEWERMTSLDRYMLNGLSSNPRLLWRALQELAKVPSHPLSDRGRAPWAHVEADVASEVARAEVRMAHETAVALMGLEYLDGRAFVLARAAGRRVARAIPAIYDLHADDEIGPIELDWAYLGPGKALVWQAHVSKGDGAFAAAASLSAAAAAALCLVDMVRDRDPTASIVLVKVSEEPWSVGQAADEEDSSTAIFRGGASNNIARLVEAHRKQAAAKISGQKGPEVGAASQHAVHDPVSESIRQSGHDHAAVPVGVSGNTAALIIPAGGPSPPAGATSPAALSYAAAAPGGYDPQTGQPLAVQPMPNPATYPSAPAAVVNEGQGQLDAHRKSMQDPTQLVSRKATAAMVAAATGSLPPAAQGINAPGPLVYDDPPPPPRTPVALLVVGGIALVALLGGLAFLLLR